MGTAFATVFESYPATAATQGGNGQKQAYTQAVRFGGKADVTCHFYLFIGHTYATVLDIDVQFIIDDLGIDADLVRTGIRRIVQQVDDGLLDSTVIP
jgi:hypothetical protein